MAPDGGALSRAEKSPTWCSLGGARGRDTAGVGAISCLEGARELAAVLGAVLGTALGTLLGGPVLAMSIATIAAAARPMVLGDVMPRLGIGAGITATSAGAHDERMLCTPTSCGDMILPIEPPLVLAERSSICASTDRTAFSSILELDIDVSKVCRRR